MSSVTLGKDHRSVSFSASLTAVFGPRLQAEVSLARYTAVRIGGPADYLLTAETADDLAEIVSALWQMDIPFLILGGGSNLLISDAGVRGVVVVNRTRQARFDPQLDPPLVWAESGINFGALARQAAALGLSGLEWASGIPGTLGGAIVGNAGAHGGEVAGSLARAEVLSRVALPVEGGKWEVGSVREEWPVERFGFGYRSSLLKAQRGASAGFTSLAAKAAMSSSESVVLSAVLWLAQSNPGAVQARIERIAAIRRRNQPPGASMGSMFKNPPGDHAGRLIEAAGLKGHVLGDAEISPVHANFFINRGQATAQDMAGLIRVAQARVAEQFGVNLELEVELLGDWEQEVGYE